MLSVAGFGDERDGVAATVIEEDRVQRHVFRVVLFWGFRWVLLDRCAVVGVWVGGYFAGLRRSVAVFPVGQVSWGLAHVFLLDVTVVG